MTSTKAAAISNDVELYFYIESSSYGEGAYAKINNNAPIVLADLVYISGVGQYVQEVVSCQGGAFTLHINIGEDTEFGENFRLADSSPEGFTTYSFAQTQQTPTVHNSPGMVEGSTPYFKFKYWIAGEDIYFEFSAIQKASGASDRPTLSIQMDFNQIPWYNVTFKSDGATYGTPESVKKGSLISAPTEPTKANHDFEGWYTEATFENAWDFSTNTVTAETTLWAKFIEHGKYVVTFESHGGSTHNPIDVYVNTTVTRPADPTRAGYIFDGWFTDNETFENEFDFETPITGSITLHAKWTIDPNAIIEGNEGDEDDVTDDTGAGKGKGNGGEKNNVVDTVLIVAGSALLLAAISLAVALGAFHYRGKIKKTPTK